MEFLEKVFSKTDNAIKYVWKSDDNKIIELTYINKDDGKDIICIPSQTMCNMGCKFCHTTEYIGKIKCRNLTEMELVGPMEYVICDLRLYENKRTLLISIMGCGEPLYNIDNIVEMMDVFKKHAEKNFKIPDVRYDIATCIPKNKWENFFKLTKLIKEKNLPVKIYLSLHYTIDSIRKDWMPLSLDIIPSISAIDFYKKVTNNDVVIHYTLIDGVNDTEQDAILLSSFLKGKDIYVKFLHFNEKETLDYHASNIDRIKTFKKHLEVNNIEYEYYTPPAIDIGGSCGQFLLETYEKYEKK